MTSLKVKIKKLSSESIQGLTPTYGTDGAAAFDFYTPHDVEFDGWADETIRTGIAMEIPPGYALLLFSRSGQTKENVRLTNCVGVIDSDYRGEIFIKLTKDNPYTLTKYPAGSRIAQGIIIPIPRVEFVEVSELSETTRGEGGFGSTGV